MVPDHARRDGDAVDALYQRTLGRGPTEREQAKCLEYLQKLGRRAEAMEDIWWALINSPEFLTRR